MSTLTKSPPPDRSRITVEHEDELKHWAKHLGVTEEALRQTVAKVGANVATVRKELRNLQAQGGTQLGNKPSDV